MQETNIGWTDFSSNPVKYRDKRTGKIVWACVKCSGGCKNCYSEELALRWGRGNEFTPSNMNLVDPFVDTKELTTILTSKKITGKRVFIEDMSDLFGSWVADEMIDQVFAAMALRSDATFQVLTKRADRMARYLLKRNRVSSLELAANALQAKGGHCSLGGERVIPRLPLPNVLIGFSAENQRWFDRRSADAKPLMKAGWKVWTSFEPLLDRIVVQGNVGRKRMKWLDRQLGLKWGVVGGESGCSRRACDVKFIIDLATQFKTAGVPFFVKQDSARYPGKQGRIPLEIWEMKQHTEVAA